MAGSPTAWRGSAYQSAASHSPASIIALISDGSVPKPGDAAGSSANELRSNPAASVT